MSKERKTYPCGQSSLMLNAGLIVLTVCAGILFSGCGRKVERVKRGISDVERHAEKIESEMNSPGESRHTSEPARPEPN